MKQSLTSEINSLYHSWLTSTDPAVSYRSFTKFIKKLEVFTYRYIRTECKELLPFSEDIFSELLEKTYIAHMKQEIDTIDYFCSWYRTSILNHTINYHKYLNRDKRVNILNEFQLGVCIDEIEFNVCVQNYYSDQRQQDIAEIICIIFPLERDKELFYDRHVLGISVDVLALNYETTDDGVKSRLKRVKQRLYHAYIKQSKHN